MLFKREKFVPQPETKPEPAHVYCNICGVAVTKFHAQQIKVLSSAFGGGGEEYRCQTHRAEYDEVLRPTLSLSAVGIGASGASSYYQYFNPTTEPRVPRYFKRMEVTEDGTPLGFVAKKKK